MMPMVDDEKFEFNMIQDFFSKRAVAHSSFFVASIFGLFTILSFMIRFRETIEIDFWKFWLLTITYLLIWVFGAYSFANFTYYAKLAHKASTKVDRTDRVNKLIDEAMKETKGFLGWFTRQFYKFKRGTAKDDPARKGLPNEVMNKIRTIKDAIFFSFYVCIALLPLITLFL